MAKQKKSEKDIGDLVNKHITKSKKNNPNIETVTEQEFLTNIKNLIDDYVEKIREYTDAYNSVLMSLENIRAYKELGYRIKYTLNHEDNSYNYLVVNKDPFGFTPSNNDDDDSDN